MALDPLTPWRLCQRAAARASGWSGAAALAAVATEEVEHPLLTAGPYCNPAAQGGKKWPQQAIGGSTGVAPVDGHGRFGQRRIAVSFGPGQGEGQDDVHRQLPSAARPDGPRRQSR